MLKKSLFHPPDPGAPRRAFSRAAFSQKWPHLFEQQPEFLKWILC
jgi:hypothetical protein